MLEIQIKGNANVNNSELEALGYVAAFLMIASNVPVKTELLQFSAKIILPSDGCANYQQSRQELQD